MNEIDRITDQLRRSFERDAWHGSAVLELLDGVTAEQAARRPIADGHSIWELVLHMTTWKDAVRRKLAGCTFEVTPELDWPAVPSENGANWMSALEALRASHHALTAAVTAVADADLDRVPAGEKRSRYVLLHGVIQHDLYHAAQVALLKRG